VIRLQLGIPVLVQYGEYAPSTQVNSQVRVSLKSHYDIAFNSYCIST